jgi:hypothetical protein
MWIDLMNFLKIFEDTLKMFNNYTLQFYAQEIGREARRHGLESPEMLTVENSLEEYEK